MRYIHVRHNSLRLEENAYALEMIPIPAPATRRPTVKRLASQLSGIRIGPNRDPRRTTNDDHLEDNTDSEKDDGNSETTFSTRPITVCQSLVSHCR